MTQDLPVDQYDCAPAGLTNFEGSRVRLNLFELIAGELFQQAIGFQDLDDATDRVLRGPDASCKGGIRCVSVWA